MSARIASSTAAEAEVNRNAKLCEAAKHALVCEDGGKRSFLTISPNYVLPLSTHKLVLGSRVSICLLSAATLLFTLVGQLVDYRVNTDTSTRRKTKEHLSVWTLQDDQGFRKDNAIMQSFTVLSVVFSVLALIFSALFAVRWTKMQAARRDDLVRNRLLLQEYDIECDRDLNKVLVQDSYACDRAWRVNAGQVVEPPLETRERERRAQDNEFGVAAFSMLLLGGICVLVVLILMSQDVDDDICYSTKRSCRPSSSSEATGGLVLYAFAFALTLIAVVLVSMPALSRLYLCYAPPLERCRLVLVNLNADMHSSDASISSGADY